MNGELIVRPGGRSFVMSDDQSNPNYTQPSYAPDSITYWQDGNQLVGLGESEEEIERFDIYEYAAHSPLVSEIQASPDPINLAQRIEEIHHQAVLDGKAVTEISLVMETAAHTQLLASRFNSLVRLRHVFDYSILDAYHLALAMSYGLEGISNTALTRSLREKYAFSLDAVTVYPVIATQSGLEVPFEIESDAGNTNPIFTLLDKQNPERGKLFEKVAKVAQGTGVFLPNLARDYGTYMTQRTRGVFDLDFPSMLIEGPDSYVYAQIKAISDKVSMIEADRYFEDGVEQVAFPVIVDIHLLPADDLQQGAGGSMLELVKEAVLKPTKGSKKDVTQYPSRFKQLASHAAQNFVARADLLAAIASEQAEIPTLRPRDAIIVTVSGQTSVALKHHPALEGINLVLNHTFPGFTPLYTLAAHYADVGNKPDLPKMSDQEIEDLFWLALIFHINLNNEVTRNRSGNVNTRDIYEKSMETHSSLRIRPDVFELFKKDLETKSYDEAMRSALQKLG